MPPCYYTANELLQVKQHVNKTVLPIDTWHKILSLNINCVKPTKRGRHNLNHFQESIETNNSTVGAKFPCSIPTTNCGTAEEDQHKPTKIARPNALSPSTFTLHSEQSIKLCCLNVRSLANKALLLLMILSLATRLIFVH